MNTSTCCDDWSSELEKYPSCPYCATIPEILNLFFRDTPEKFIEAINNSDPSEKDCFGYSISVDYRDPWGTPPSHIVCEDSSRSLEDLEKLVDAGADVNIISFEGQDLLSSAMENDRVDIMKFLVSVGADYNYVDEEGKNWKDRSPCFYPLMLSDEDESIRKKKIIEEVEKIISTMKNIKG